MFGKVNKQFKHAQSMNDTICKFNSLWISFNCFYNIKFNKGNDRSNIDFIKNESDIKEIFLKLDNNIKQTYFDFINNRLDLGGGVKKLNSGNIVKYNDIENFGDFLEIVYTIRNNQFHGGKDWEDEGDLELLKATNIIFEVFLGKLYRNINII